MEKLTVQNFLSICSAELEVRRINVLIGPQASGKSIIAKLLYFFKQEVGEAFQESVRNQHGKRELNAALTAKFESIFPRSYWYNQDFFIAYDCNTLNVTVKGLKSASGRFTLSVTFSDWLPRLQSTLKKRYKLALEEAKHKPENQDDPFAKEERFIFFRSCNAYIKNSEYSQYFEGQIFIPASRTFFASLQKNIFSFLSSNIDIDYFLKGFGSVYEQAKRFYMFRRTREAKTEWRKEFDKIMEDIIVGRYLYENEQDWILASSKKINLANASSGQQESLPMLLVLSVMPFFNKEDKGGYFIEEPEAHLFPVSQKAFISLLALLSNTTLHQFFITTHSPYLLTALNNCILAHSTYEAADDAGKAKVLKMLPKNQHVAFADVAAWTVTAKGTVESILDEDLQLIGASLLDEVSQQFETVTNELLDIRYAGQA